MKKQYKKPAMKSVGNVEKITLCGYKQIGCKDSFMFGSPRGGDNAS
jgi:hypothetical protein